MESKFSSDYSCTTHCIFSLDVHHYVCKLELLTLSQIIITIIITTNWSDLNETRTASPLSIASVIPLIY